MKSRHPEKPWFILFSGWTVFVRGSWQDFRVQPGTVHCSRFRVHGHRVVGTSAIHRAL
jgi:hypothetical protein